MSDPGCKFCRIIKGELPAYIIDENEHVIVFLSLENHPMIVPKAHIRDIYAMPSDVGAHVMEEMIKIAKAVKKGLQCDGVYINQCNEPAAGQDVFHYHTHIYPCWEGKPIKAIPRNLTNEVKTAMQNRIQAALAEE